MAQDTEKSILFVAQHKETGLYQRKVGATFIRWDCREWIKAKNPTNQQIRDEILIMRKIIEDNGGKVWTDDINDCEIWDQYDIDHCLKYFPELEMINVHLKVVGI